MSQWLESFSRWPPLNQLLFSCVFVAAWILALFMFGFWVIQLLRHISIVRHGWPGKPRTIFTGIDWKQLTKELQNEAEFQAMLHKETQEKLAQVGQTIINDVVKDSPEDQHKEEQRQINEEDERQAERHHAEINKTSNKVPVESNSIDHNKETS